MPCTIEINTNKSKCEAKIPEQSSILTGCYVMFENIPSDYTSNEDSA